MAEVAFEYLDHTADVQIHAWGPDLAGALEQTGMGMFGYMTELESVDVSYSYDVEAQGSDADSLLFHFLDEWLFAFSAEPFFIPRVIRVLELDQTNWRLKARGWGETFQARTKHPQGTEVKAITYSNMQIHSQPDKTDVYVILDV